MPVPEHHKRDERQQRAEDSKQETGPLTSQIMEKLAREQRCHAAERVPHQALAGDRRRRVLAVAVGRKAIRRLEDEEYAKGDGRQRERRRDPGQVAVLREAVDEEAERQEPGAAHGAVEAGFRQDGAVVGQHDGLVLADLQEVGREADGDADAERDVGQAGHALAEAVFRLEGDGDHG